MAFTITPKTPSSKDIATIEVVVKNFRPKISLTFQNSELPKDNLSKEEHKALKELLSETSIVILTAGKSRSTVILNREDCLEKCMDYINIVATLPTLARNSGRSELRATSFRLRCFVKVTSSE